MQPTSLSHLFVVTTLFVLLLLFTHAADITNSGEVQWNAALNKAIIELNNNGIMSQLNMKYGISLPNTDCSLLGEYTQNPIGIFHDILQEKQKITFCQFHYGNDRPPFFSLNGNSGFSSDLAAAITQTIAEHYGVTLTYDWTVIQNYNYWGQMLTALNRYQCDAILAETIYSIDKSLVANPTCSYTQAPLVFVTYNRPDIVTVDDLDVSGTYVGQVTGRLVTKLDSLPFRSVIQTYYYTRGYLYQGLKAKEIDAALDVYPYAEYIVNTQCPPTSTNPCNYNMTVYDAESTFVMFTRLPPVVEASVSRANSIMTRTSIVYILCLFIINSII
jgi:hypothetical protein